MNKDDVIEKLRNDGAYYEDFSKKYLIDLTLWLRILRNRSDSRVNTFAISADVDDCKFTV